MATVTGYTAERMLEIENSTIVDGDIVGDNLILKTRDDTEIDAGNVRGPLGNGPIGTIIDYIGSVAPSASWLTMVGQTVVNAETLYVALWAIIPASMKSGSSMIMPDTRGRVAVGYDAAQTEFNVIGEVGGEKTHVLTDAEMPNHTHTGDPHTHTVNPPNTAVTISDPGHAHATNIKQSNYQNGTSGPQQNYAVWQDGELVDPNITGITASVDIAPFASGARVSDGDTGAAGSDAEHNNLQPYVTFLKLIKVL